MFQYRIQTLQAGQVYTIAIVDTRAEAEEIRAYREDLGFRTRLTQFYVPKGKR